MTSSSTPKVSPSYDPIPQQQHHQHQYVVVLPYHRRHPFFRRYCLSLSLFLLLSAAAFLLFPSDPELSLVRAHVSHLKVHASPVSLDLTLDLTLRIKNRDFYSVHYDFLRARVAYRGKDRGTVEADQGDISPRASSYVNATVKMEKVEFLDDLIHLITDLAKGFISFDTVTEMGGDLGLGLFQIPIKAKVACEIVVNVHNLTISHQNCYPE